VVHLQSLKAAPQLPGRRESEPLSIEPANEPSDLDYLKAALRHSRLVTDHDEIMEVDDTQSVVGASEVGTRSSGRSELPLVVPESGDAILNECADAAADQWKNMQKDDLDSGLPLSVRLYFLNKNNECDES